MLYGPSDLDRSMAVPFLSIQVFTCPLLRSVLNRKSGSGRGGSLLAEHEPASPALVPIHGSIAATKHDCEQIYVGKKSNEDQVDIRVILWDDHSIKLNNIPNRYILNRTYLGGDSKCVIMFQERAPIRPLIV